MQLSEEEWARVGAVLRVAFDRADKSLEGAAHAAGVSDRYLRDLMAGTVVNRGRPNLVKVGKLYGWPADWIDRVLDGTPPTPERLTIPTGVAAEQVRESIAAARALLDQADQLLRAPGSVPPPRRQSAGRRGRS